MHLQTIHVIGHAEIPVTPDTIEIAFTVEARGQQYETVLKQAEENHRALEQAVEAAGFLKTALKTGGLAVTSEYSYPEGKRVFDGFRASRPLTLSFAIDFVRFGALLSSLEKIGNAGPEYRISFTLKNKEAAGKQAMEAAVSDALLKARILADAAGVGLGRILTIDYKNAPISVAPMRMRSEFSDVSLTPEDVLFREQVEITFELGGKPCN